MVKHTPGPWKCIAVEGGWDGVSDEMGMVICKLVFNNPKNAALIAAAPELLEAAYITVRVCEMWQTGQLKETSAYKAAVAAIIKAEGRTP